MAWRVRVVFFMFLVMSFCVVIVCLGDVLAVPWPYPASDRASWGGAVCWGEGLPHRCGERCTHIQPSSTTIQPSVPFFSISIIIAPSSFSWSTHLLNDAESILSDGWTVAAAGQSDSAVANSSQVSSLQQLTCASADCRPVVVSLNKMLKPKLFTKHENLSKSHSSCLALGDMKQMNVAKMKWSQPYKSSC